MYSWRVRFWLNDNIVSKICLAQNELEAEKEFFGYDVVSVEWLY